MRKFLTALILLVFTVPSMAQVIVRGCEINVAGIPFSASQKEDEGDVDRVYCTKASSAVALARLDNSYSRAENLGKINSSKDNYCFTLDKVKLNRIAVFRVTITSNRTSELFVFKNSTGTCLYEINPYR